MARYLKSIILQGFKSFPLKTDIQFVDGITGIVGANGSGKSNIVESIKWVLGEQSARSLRGEKMEDIIFNGTKDRLPSSMAEVSLIFDNEKKWLPLDYTEVEITRRMFRSGESQYFINRSKVRLKDIVELFLDTGIGRDSYSIFEQGKIDRLLSESPEERRILFEDFAGISKFKFRKEEALKKLENSSTNLQRLNDIIFTLENEVESLRNQAEVAKQYNELKLKLKECELKFEALRVKNFKKEIESKIRQKEENEKKQQSLHNQLEEIEAKIIDTEGKIIEIENLYSLKKDEYSRIEKFCSESKLNIKGGEEKKDFLQKQLKGMETRLSEGIEKSERLAKELESKQKEFDTIIEETERINENILTVQQKIDDFQKNAKNIELVLLEKSKKLGFQRIVTKDDVEKASKEIVTLQIKLENLKANLEEKNNQLKNLEFFLNEGFQKEEDLKKQLEKQKKELEDVVAEIEENKKREENLKIQNKNLQQQIKEIQSKIKELDEVILGALEKQANEIKNFSTKKGMLESEVINSINELKDLIEKNETKEKIFLLLDKIKKVFEEYKESYRKIIDIIYKDENGYLRKEEYHKKLEQFREEIEENNGFIERINLKNRELIELKENLLKNYQLTEFEYNRFLTEKNKSIKSIEALKQNIKDVEGQIFSISSLIKNKEASFEDLVKAIDEYEEELKEIREKRSVYLEELNSYKIEYSRFDEKKKALKTEIERLRKEITEIELMKKDYEKDRTSILQTIEDLEKIIETEKQKLKENEIKLESLKNELETFRINLDGFEKHRKSLELERKNIMDNLQKLERTIMNIESGISERRAFMESIRENVFKTYSVDIDTVEVGEEDSFEALSTEISKCREALQAFGEVNFLAIEQYQTTKEKLDFLLEQKKDVEKAIEDIKKLIDETNEKSEEKFSTSFEEIRKAFKKIFARLFDGGRADLILENKNDILNSGINIMAEPPGKKFQSISLLSGGERALVAIAVIFSILYLKPTPFVVLDEIDAPLDDDNIERFKSLLKEFKETSQFIIVSHSKSTLEICDALYGVTMEEQGVSKVVSVAFNEAEKIVENIEAQLKDL